MNTNCNADMCGHIRICRSMSTGWANVMTNRVADMWCHMMGNVIYFKSCWAKAWIIIVTPKHQCVCEWGLTVLLTCDVTCGCDIIMSTYVDPLVMTNRDANIWGYIVKMWCKQVESLCVRANCDAELRCFITGNVTCQLVEPVLGVYRVADILCHVVTLWTWRERTK